MSENPDESDAQAVNPAIYPDAEEYARLSAALNRPYNGVRAVHAQQLARPSLNGQRHSLREGWDD